VRRIFKENHTICTRSCDDESISTCLFPEMTTKGWDASYARAARSTSASAYLAPTICMDTGSPDVAKPQGTVAAGCCVIRPEGNGVPSGGTGVLGNGNGVSLDEDTMTFGKQESARKASAG
jgi:hypothetical protein